MQVRILHPLQRLFVEILLNNYLDGSSILPTSTNRPCKSESMVWLAEKQITIFGGCLVLTSKIVDSTRMIFKITAKVITMNEAPLRMAA